MSRTRPRPYRILLPAVALALACLTVGAPRVVAQWSPIYITPQVHVTTSFGIWDTAHAVIELPDGRFVAGGYTGDHMADVPAEVDFALARYMPDGSLDPTFGNAGKVTSNFGIDRQLIYDLALEPDGRLLAAGLMHSLAGYDSYMVVARYMPDGQLDASFGTGGHVALNPAVRDSNAAYAVALQPDGRIVLAGLTGRVLAVVRLTADGALDASFGSGGISKDLAPGVKLARDITVRPDGKLLVVASYTDRMVVLCLDDKGNLDPNFGAGGMSVLDSGHGGTWGRFGRGVAIGLLADGRIQAAGHIRSPRRDCDHHVARLLHDGGLDASFADRGQLHNDVFNESADYTTAMVIRPDRSALIVSRTAIGGSASSGDPGIGLALLDPQGDLDPRFGARAAPGEGFVGSVRSTTLQPSAAAPLGLDRAVVASTQVDTSGRVREADFAMTILELPAVNLPPTASATATRPTETPTTIATTITSTPTPSSTRIVATPTPSAMTPTVPSRTPTRTPTPLAPTPPAPQWTIYLPLALDSALLQS